MERLKHEAGIDVLHAPYKNGSTAATALIGGEVNVDFDSLFSAISRAKSGQVKILGVMQGQRASAVPDIMSTSDAGYPKVGYMAWLALFAPSATPVTTLDVIASAVRQVASQADIQKRFAELGTEVFAVLVGEEFVAVDEEEEGGRGLADLGGVEEFEAMSL